MCIAYWLSREEAAKRAYCTTQTIDNLLIEYETGVDKELVSEVNKVLYDQRAQLDALLSNAIKEATKCVARRVADPEAAHNPRDVAASVDLLSKVQGTHVTENNRIAAKREQAKASGLVIPELILRFRDEGVAPAGDPNLEPDDE